jgi:hypothetical protein
MVFKPCHWDNRRCFHFCCGYVDILGNVQICRRCLNPSGIFTLKRVVAYRPIFSVWNKHLRGGS